MALARVPTDYTHEAFVFDVIVSDEYRGTGLGGRPIEAILDAPVLATDGHVERDCLPDRVGPYGWWGIRRGPGRPPGDSVRAVTDRTCGAPHRVEPTH